MLNLVDNVKHLKGHGQLQMVIVIESMLFKNFAPIVRGF
jgi:hypothetical protein